MLQHSSPPRLETSKQQKLFVKLTCDEMQRCVSELGDVCFYSLGRVLKKGSAQLFSMKEWIGVVGISRSESTFYSMPVGEDRELIKPCEPVIEMNAAHFLFNRDRKEFLLSAPSNDTFAWGIYFSFPALFRDPKTEKICTTTNHPNGSLFRGLRKWVRHHSNPMSFQLDGQRITAPFRIGKNCLCDYPDIE